MCLESHSVWHKKSSLHLAHTFIHLHSLTFIHFISYLHEEHYKKQNSKLLPCSTFVNISNWTQYSKVGSASNPRLMRKKRPRASTHCIQCWLSSRSNHIHPILNRLLYFISHVYLCIKWMAQNIPFAALMATRWHHNEDPFKFKTHFRVDVARRVRWRAPVIHVAGRLRLVELLSSGVLHYRGLCWSGVRTKIGVDMVFLRELGNTRSSKEGWTGPGRERSRSKPPYRSVVG